MEFEREEVQPALLDNYKSRLVPWDDPILYKKTEPFDYINPPMHPIQLYNELVLELVYCNGLGISANQIGYPWSVFLTRDGNMFFNPRIVSFGQETVSMLEGCLSFPGIAIEIVRASTIKVRYQTLVEGAVTSNTDNTVTNNFVGMTARVIQHELDHLNGKPFFHTLSRTKIDMAVRKAEKLGVHYKNIHKVCHHGLILPE